jgi:hypothetical protein
VLTFFFWLTGRVDWAFWPRYAFHTPYFYCFWMICTPLCFELNFNLFSAYSKSLFKVLRCLINFQNCLFLI